MTRKQKRTIKTVLLYIVLFILAVLLLFPLLWGIPASLRSDNELFSKVMPFTWHTLVPVEWSFQSYIDLFRKI